MARESLAGQVGGGGWTNFEFTITNAWFGGSEAFAAKVKGGEDAIFCHWIGTTTLEGVETMEEDGFHPSFMVGDDYEVADGGKSLRYVGNPATPVSARQFKKWYGRMTTELSNNEALQALPEGQHPFDNVDPDVAAAWIGTKWFMVDKTYEWGQGRDDSNHLMPTEYLGRVAVAPVGPPTAAPTATTPPPAAAAPPAPVATAEQNGLRDQAKQLAVGEADHSIWQSAALALPGVASDATIFAEIADPEHKLYEEARA